MRSRTLLNNAKVCSNATAILSVSVLLVLGGAVASAQPPMGPMAQPASTDSQNRELADQVTELRAQVARLQSAVQQAGSGKKAIAKPGMKMSAMPAKGMGMMGEMGGMPPAGNPTMAPAMSMGDDKDEMSGMPMGGNTKMPTAPAAAMGMCCGKGASGGNGNIAMPVPAGEMAMSSPSSAMPGQPGASHLYHIGSNGFFLNHSQHITLTPDQKMSLNRMKERAMLDRSSEQRRIDQGEQELYSLTGSEQPDNGKIQGKITEIEKLRAEQRMNFIRSVEGASNVLSADQRTALLGTMAAPKK